MKNKAHITESSGDKKAFDICVMNPPYDRNLHLKILEKVIPYVEETICIHPIEQFITKRLLFDSNELKARKYIDFRHCESVEEVKNTDLFDAAFDKTIGISKYYADKEFNDDVERFVNVSNIEKSLIRKVYAKIKETNLLNSHSNDKKYVLNISPLHGNRGAITWFYISPKSYEVALKVKDHTTNSPHRNPTFDTEEERHNFYDSLFLTFNVWWTSVWKTNLRILYQYIPYLNDYSSKITNKRFCDYFNITGYISDTEAEPDSEWEEILKTMEKYK